MKKTFSKTITWQLSCDFLDRVFLTHKSKMIYDCYCSVPVLVLHVCVCCKLQSIVVLMVVGSHLWVAWRVLLNMLSSKWIEWYCVAIQPRTVQLPFLSSPGKKFLFDFRVIPPFSSGAQERSRMHKSSSNRIRKCRPHSDRIFLLYFESGVLGCLGIFRICGVDQLSSVTIYGLVI